MKNNKKNVIWFSEIRWDYMTTRKQHLIKRLSNNYNFIFIEPYKKNEKYYLYRKEKNIIIITIPTFKLGNKLLTIIFSFSLIRYLIFIFQYILLKTVIRKDISLQIISNPCFISSAFNAYKWLIIVNESIFLVDFIRAAARSVNDLFAAGSSL